MPRLDKAVRVTTPEGAIWRHCTICDNLAALAPGECVCPRCAEVIPAATVPFLWGIAARMRGRS